MTGIDRFYKGERFPDTDAQARDVSVWSERYRGLTDVLGELGTETVTRVVSETDGQIAPYYFTSATHEYVFPRQPRVLIANMSRPTEGTDDNTLTVVDMIHDVDETLVVGRIRVDYDDRDSCFTLRLKTD